MAKKKTPTVATITTDTLTRDNTTKGTHYWQYGTSSTNFQIAQKYVEGYSLTSGQIWNGGSLINDPVVVDNGDGSLSVITKYVNDKTRKFYTTTDIIKNYNEGANGKKVTIIAYDNSVSKIGSAAEGQVITNFYQKLTSGEHILNDKDDATGYFDRYYGSNKKDKYILNTTNHNVFIHDEQGKDEYTLNKESKVFDFAGNDKYNFNLNASNATATISVTDYKGNDTYNSKDAIIGDSVNDDYARVIVVDKAGSDKYFVDEDGKMGVSDEKGNDKYDLKNAIQQFGSTDKSGNDKYILTDVDPHKKYNIGGIYRGVDLTDNAGKDKYTITRSKNIKINEKAGNDSYKILDSDATNDDNKATSIQVIDEAGKETYTIKNSKNVEINDTGSGKDTYKVTKSEKVTITEGGSSEISGNDKYVFTDSKVTVSDYLGNDKYTINGGSSIVTDSKGNDTYKATAKSGHEINTLSVTDKSGKDKYTVLGSKKTKKAEAVYVKGLNIADNGAILTDAQGKEIAKSANDVYKLSYIDNTDALYNNYKIADTAGDNKYTISNSKKISVEDNAGNDQYTITSITDTFNLVDSLGNDKYTLKNIDNLTLTDNSGSDKYTLKNVANLTLTDNLGSDKYTLSGITAATLADIGGNDTITAKNSKVSGSLEINMTAGTLGTQIKGDSATFEKNTFNITNIQDVEINTNTINDISPNYNDFEKYVISKDTYNITGVTELLIKDSDAADDIYNIKKAQSASIIDRGGSDKYTIDKITGKYTIQDKATGGADLNTSKNDSLIISDKKAKIIFMADKNDLGTGTFDNPKYNALYAYDTKNGGYIKINNYFTTDFNDGDGKIETIKVGKKELTVDVNYINSVQSDVASFLGGIGEGTTIADVLDGDSQNNITALVSYFTKK